MLSRTFKRYGFLLALMVLTTCKSSIKEQKDRIYSRHLIQGIDLTIISTEMPDEKSDMNLLLFNNGSELEEMNAKRIIDSLYDKKLIQPLELVGIHADEKLHYGMSSLSDAVHGRGEKAAKYNAFVINELYPFVKKKTVIRKFRSVAICGNSLAGISAFDIAWQNADKLDMVGVFSGDFTYAGTHTVDSGPSNEVFQQLRSSRKRPKLRYWFYAAGNSDSIVLNNTKEFIDIIRKKNTGPEAGIQFVADKAGNNDMVSWRHHFAEFLLWAFGK